MENISVQREPLFHQPPFSIYLGVPIKIHFEVGNHRSFKTQSVEYLKNKYPYEEELDPVSKPG